jgi:phage FluMu protein Com
MRTPTTDIRCKQCNSLLAKRERDGVAIRRGELQATVTGSDFTIAVTCYRCRALNVVTSRPPQPPVAGAVVPLAAAPKPATAA